MKKLIIDQKYINQNMMAQLQAIFDRPVFKYEPNHLIFMYLEVLEATLKKEGIEPQWTLKK